LGGWCGGGSGGVDEKEWWRFTNGEGGGNRFGMSMWERERERGGV